MTIFTAAKTTSPQLTLIRSLVARTQQTRGRRIAPSSRKEDRVGQAFPKHIAAEDAEVEEGNYDERRKHAGPFSASVERELEHDEDTVVSESALQSAAVDRGLVVLDCESSGYEDLAVLGVEYVERTTGPLLDGARENL